VKGVDDRHTIYLPLVPAPWWSGDLLPVDAKSPRRRIEAINRFGRYIQREQNYDFPMGVPEGDVKWKAYLFVGNVMSASAVQPVGVAVFEHQPPDGTQWGDRWWLMWVWIHPFERGRGFLSRSWGFFREEFGDFHIQRPISKAMKSFLSKQQITTKKSV